MRNREICFPPGKRQIVSSIRVTFIYYNQYITSSTRSLSLSSKSNHRARGIDQIITLSSHYVSYTTFNTCSPTGLSFSLFSKSNHRARYRSNYTPLSTARFSNPCSFEFSPSSPHLPRTSSTTPRTSRRNLWLILSRFPRRR